MLMLNPRASHARAAAAAAVLATALAAPAGAQATDGPAALPASVPADTGRFAATDSTLVVVVPSGASSTSVLGAVRAVRGRAVTAVYTTDELAARRLGAALATTVGASLVPYDRAGATPDAYAARLVRNALAANPRGAVMIVGDAVLTDPIFREAAAASGVSTARNAHAGGGPDGVVVLGVAPRTRSLVRDRF